MEFYQNDEPNLIRKVCGWVVDIVVMIAFAWFCLTFFGTQVTVSGQSMQPLLNSGDVVLINRLSYDFGKPQRMDVVVFEREDKKSNVKRVIGIPGDVVQITGGEVYVNGKRLENESLLKVSLAGLAENPIELGEKEYFLLVIKKSIRNDIGNVKEDQIVGKVWFRIFPLINLGLIRTE